MPLFKDEYSGKDKLNPEHLLPASPQAINALANEVDELLGSGCQYESISAELLGEYKDISFGVRSEIEFDDAPKYNYQAYFQPQSEYISQYIGSNTLRVGFSQKEGPYVLFNKIKCDDFAIANKLNYYGSYLSKLLIYSEDSPDITSNKYLVTTAQAGYELVDTLLGCDKDDPDWQVINHYYDKYESADISEFCVDKLSENVMKWLQMNEQTKIRNTKLMTWLSNHNEEFTIMSKQCVKNNRRGEGLEVAITRSLDYIKNHDEKDSFNDNKRESIEFEIEHKNGQIDNNLTAVVTHNGETNFFDEIKERLNVRNRSYENGDNKIVKKPVNGDVEFFNTLISKVAHIY